MKRKLLCGLLAAAALSLPAKAARPVIVQVDGQTLESAAYVREGTAYVPLRELLESLGGWSLWWDSAAGAARAVL